MFNREYNWEKLLRDAIESGDRLLVRSIARVVNKDLQNGAVFFGRLGCGFFG